MGLNTEGGGERIVDGPVCGGISGKTTTTNQVMMLCDVCKYFLLLKDSFRFSLN